jgi:acetyl esterase/lipase
MLYLHGGAFYREIDAAHWSFIFQAARETGLDVFVPIYPLLPRLGATASNVVSRLAELVHLLSQKQEIVNITGDSAGGCIALALTQ